LVEEQYGLFIEKEKYYRFRVIKFLACLLKSISNLKIYIFSKNFINSLIWLIRNFRLGRKPLQSARKDLKA